MTFYKSLNRSNGYDFILNEYKSFNGVNIYHKILKNIHNTLEKTVKAAVEMVVVDSFKNTKFLKG